MKSNTILAANAASWIVAAVLGALLVVAIILTFVFYKKTVFLSHKVEALDDSKAAAQAEAARLVEEQTELKKKLEELERIIEQKNTELAQNESAESSDALQLEIIKAYRFIGAIRDALFKMRGAESSKYLNEEIRALLTKIGEFFGDD